MATIISAGVGSGLDLNSIVTQLVEAQRAPQQERLDTREARLQARLSGYGTLQGALSSLQQSLISLRAQTAFETRGVSIGNPDVLSATAGSGGSGSHHVQVEALATAQRMVSDSSLEQARFTSPEDILGTGTLTFSFGTTVQDEGGYSFTAAGRETRSVTITDGSLNGIRDAINQAGIGVQASIVYDGAHYRLALASSETGAANSMQITAQDADGNNSDAAGLSLLAFNAEARHMQQTQAAGDTVGLVIDGIPISSASNVLGGVVSGVDITLRAPGESSITLTADDNAAIDAIANFVDKYNALVSSFNSLSSFDAETGTASGALNGDHVLRSVETQVRKALNQLSGEAGDAFRHLSQLGITHNVEDGTLALDRERLQQALTQDRAGVAALFAGKPAEDGSRVGGVANELDKTLAALLSRDGIFTAATTSINVNIRDIARQRELLELRTLAFEERTRAQFSAMDTLVGQLRSTSDFLSQQLANLPAIGRSNG
jgi:flagellar hook-associated protein 2